MMVKCLIRKSAHYYKEVINYIFNIHINKFNFAYICWILESLGILLYMAIIKYNPPINSLNVIITIIIVVIPIITIPVHLAFCDCYIENNKLKGVEKII